MKTIGILMTRLAAFCLLLACFSFILAGCGTEPTEPLVPPPSPTLSPEKTSAAEVKDGDTVKVHYTGTLVDGTVFDSSLEGEPLEFTLGAGNIIPGFEEAVRGMQVEQSKTFTIPVDKAYGPHREDRIGSIKREQFPEDINPYVGQRLQVRLTEDSPAVPVIVIEVTEMAIIVDANHPLAGKDLTFEIELVEIK